MRVRKNSAEKKRRSSGQSLAENKKKETSAPIYADSSSDESAPSDPETFIVEKVLAKRLVSGPQIQYLIKWKGFDNPADNTWENVLDCDCQLKIDEFEREEQKSAEKKKKEEQKIMKSLPVAANIASASDSELSDNEIPTLDNSGKYKFMKGMQPTITTVTKDEKYGMLALLFYSNGHFEYAPTQVLAEWFPGLLIKFYEDRCMPVR